MADYGLKIFDSGGITVLDTTHALARLVYRNDVALGVSGNSGDLSSLINGKTTLEVAWGKRNVGRSVGCAHKVTRTGDTIYWVWQGDTSSTHTYWMYQPSDDSVVLCWIID